MNLYHSQVEEHHLIYTNSFLIYLEKKRKDQKFIIEYFINNIYLLKKNSQYKEFEINIKKKNRELVRGQLSQVVDEMVVPQSMIQYDLN